MSMYHVWVIVCEQCGTRQESADRESIYRFKTALRASGWNLGESDHCKLCLDHFAKKARELV